MNYYRSNFDFENQIKNKNFKKNIEFDSDKNNYEFEYLFFFLNFKGVLNSPIRYSRNYCDYLKKYFKINIDVENTPMENYLFWWGDLEKIELSRMLNNKDFFWKFCLQNKIPYPKSGPEIKNIQKQKIIVRKKYGYSGKGLKIIDVDDFFLVKEDEIASILMDKKIDFGLLLYENNIDIYQTIIDERGQFKGVQSLNDPKIIDLILPFIESLRKLKNYASYPFQIDGFLSKNGEIFFNELNYRLTMGSIFIEILKNYFPNNSARLQILRYKNYLNLDFSHQNLIGLTPIGSEYSYRFGLVFELLPNDM